LTRASSNSIQLNFLFLEKTACSPRILSNRVPFITWLVTLKSLIDYLHNFKNRSSLANINIGFSPTFFVYQYSGNWRINEIFPFEISASSTPTI
jgi:hypothetical protein